MAAQMAAISSSICRVITPWFFMADRFCRISDAGVIGYEPSSGFSPASLAPATSPRLSAWLPMMLR